MKRAVIHIGNLKTGTTAIQAVLRKLRPELARHQVFMPGLAANQPAHYEIEFELGKPAAEAPRFSKTLADIAAAPEGSTVLLTAETMMYVEPAVLKTVLEGVGVTDFTVICYLRPHISMMGSLYLQMVKGGIFRGPMSEHAGIIRTAPMHFLEVVRGFGEVFGKEAVICREFHRSVLADGSVVNDFWDVAGLPADLRAQAVAIETISNPTPTAEMAMLVRACTNFLYDHAPPEHRQGGAAATGATGEVRQTATKLFRQVARKESLLPGTKYQIPLTYQEAFNARFQDERRSFAETWFRQPASKTWLAETVAAPQPLLDLPAKLVRRLIDHVAGLLRAEGLSYTPDALARFAAELPIRREGGKEWVVTEDLARVFALAPEVAPEPARLSSLMQASALRKPNAKASVKA